MQSASAPAEIRPTLSIVTICKDHPAGFQDTMNSVAQQLQYTAAHTVEWIVVNGSTESSAVAEMVDANSHIVNWSQSKADKGIYDAMNIGLDHMSGSFVQFMNAGDTFAAPWTVAEMQKTLEENPQCDFLYGSCSYQNNMRGTQPLEYIKYGMPAAHQSMLYKQDVIGDLRYNTGYKLAADYQFTMEYLNKAKHPMQTDQVLSNFEGGGSTYHQFLRTAREVFDIRSKQNKISLFENTALTALRIAGGAIRRYMPQSVYRSAYNAYAKQFLGQT